ncbi:MAG: hypothetical protein ACI4MH_02465 [Candidatus Coproplasma sp.]
MAKKVCKTLDDFDGCDKIYECPRCGNHVCKECAAMWSETCPHCFGRLYRIS